LVKQIIKDTKRKRWVPYEKKVSMKKGRELLKKSKERHWNQTLSNMTKEYTWIYIKKRKETYEDNLGAVGMHVKKTSNEARRNIRIYMKKKERKKGNKIQKEKIINGQMKRKRSKMRTSFVDRLLFLFLFSLLLLKERKPLTLCMCMWALNGWQVELEDRQLKKDNTMKLKKGKRVKKNWKIVTCRWGREESDERRRWSLEGVEIERENDWIN